jgi:hypothetical protein
MNQGLYDRTAWDGAVHQQVFSSKEFNMNADPSQKGNLFEERDLVSHFQSCRAGLERANQRWRLMD